MANSLKKSRYLGYLLLMAAGVLLCVISFRHLAARPAVWLLDVVCIIFGAGLFGWQLLKFIRTFRRDVRRFVKIKSETGSVRVHAGAVEQALRHTAKSLPEVHDVRVRLVLDKQSGLPSAGEVDARIKDITNIVSVHDALSKVLAERYQQIIPGAPTIDFHLTIKHHFKPPREHKAHHKKKKSVPPEEDETKSIRAPQYPVPK